MPQINILNILQGDAQSTIVDKLNYNFDQILSAGGGPQGTQGLIGPTGPIGPQGPQGVQGVQGPSGTKWFVQDTSPASGGITGSNPWQYPTLGDYWLDPDSAAQDVYVFTATGWVNTGYGLAAGDLFQKITPINIIGGATGQAIVIAGATANNKSVVLSDSNVADYTPGGTAIDNLNYEDSKLKIATKNTRTKLISFGRSDYDITPGGSGSSSSNYNPYFSWDLSVNPSGSSGAGIGFYGINFTNPKGSISISSIGATAESGINMLSTSEISAVSSSDNIILKTSSVDKGTFIDGSSNGGFLEFSNNTSTPTNQSFAPLFANPTGVGIGLGTGQFKQTGDDSRRLSVLGNSSISKTLLSHTASLFIGGDVSTPNYNKGVLFVEGHSMFGYTNPTGDNSGGIQTTGPSEASGRYPQLFVASPNYGPGIQIKTKGVNYSPRTIIGDGVFDGAGTGPNITQEFFAGTGYNFGAFNLPLISYTHKISNISNSGASGPVFAITTFSNGGVYNYSSVAHRTLIEAKNSNKRIDIMANGTGGQNAVTIGVVNSSLLSVYGGSGATYGGVTIGTNSTLSPTLVALTGANFVANNRSNHSLYVTGVQSIGTSDPISLFNRSSTGKGANVGGNSLMKIHRNLYSSTSSIGKGTYASGFSVNNYPNGLEITSIIPVAASTGASANDSVAICVGASTGSSPVTQASTTGFFVSNKGTNISIGQFLDYSAAIGVSGAGSNAAIKALGNVGVTGDLQLYGNISTTGTNNFYGDQNINTSIGGGSLTLGPGGTPIKKVVSGSVVCPMNGTSTTILRGSGFTASMTASGLNTARVQITFTTPFSTNELVALCSVFSGTPANVDLGVFVYAVATTSCEFIFSGAGSGTVTLNFSVQEVL